MKVMRRMLLLLVVVAMCATPALAQPFASGLLFPSKVIFTPRGHLLVAENGNGPNTGRISIVDRNTGVRRTLISGLPSGISSADGPPTPSGPAGLFLSGNILYVVIAEGDGVLAGPVAGTQVPNPTPASPILSSLLAMNLAGPIDDMTGNLSITSADHVTLKSGKSVSVGSGTNQATITLVADFDNYRDVPRPDFFFNVQHSDPYGVAVLGGFAYVAEAGQNLIRKVNIATGETTTLTNFPSIVNTTGVGGPVIEAVPDSIRLDGNRLLVTLLTGFPFAANLSQVVAVDPTSGAVTPVVDGLTTAIDEIPLTTSSGRQYVISEFSSNLESGAPGRILLANGTAKSVIADGIVSPASIAVDPRTREIFVAQIFPGTITRIDAALNLPSPVPSSIIPVVGSVNGAFGSRFETSLQISNPHPYAISGVMNVRTADGTRPFSYQLAPHETKSFTYFMNAVGLTGVATVDIEAGVGPAPVAVARIFDISRSTASTGVVIQQMSPDDAFQAGDSAALVGAADPTVSRTNIGIRPLDAGATLNFSLSRADGTPLTTVTKTYAPNVLVQQSVTDLFGQPPAPGDSIVIGVASGSAIIYAATVNNITQETSFQRAAKVTN